MSLLCAGNMVNLQIFFIFFQAESLVLLQKGSRNLYILICANYVLAVKYTNQKSSWHENFNSRHNAFLVFSL